VLSTDSIRATLATCNCEVAEIVERAGHPPQFAPIPEGLAPQVQEGLAAVFPRGLYRHQAQAIQTGIAGTSFCIATPTASGKTAIFTSVVVDRLLKNPEERVIVLYPAKALIQDQLGKWARAVEETKLQVNFIDGSIDTGLRKSILVKTQIVLMTPDVLHAWFMSNQSNTEIRDFAKRLSIVVMDEAHVYEGVFGTNMAYLLRRLRAITNFRQIIASTATIGEPGKFLGRLTGLQFQVFDHANDGAGAPDKVFILANVPVRKISPVLKSIIKLFDGQAEERFLVFADSRKRVEELVADARSKSRKAESSEQEHNTAESPEDASDEQTQEVELDDDGLTEVMVELHKSHVLPYRAGYEEDDRLRIQKALETGTLNGVVSTSALELGIDIGEISLVIMVGVPPSVKSFWQRAGRTARRKAGQVLILDTAQRIQPGRLNAYLSQPAEENWLYLDNEYLQYANVLCATDELLMVPTEEVSREPFEDLPEQFDRLLQNEIDPTEQVPTDLYALKQAAGASKPQFAFPVRSGIEKQYKVICPRQPGRVFGNLSYSQLMNEAFPGAIYRYMAHPFRVYQIKHPRGEVKTNAIKGIGKTVAIKLARTFPTFGSETKALYTSINAFYAETAIQVSERVTGFIEHWGQNKKEHTYGPESTYSQKPLARYFDSTGCCIYVSDIEYSKEKVARYVALAFCRVCSIHERDIGHGVFSASHHPLGNNQVSGIAVYDGVQGSLRLTQFLLPNMTEILQQAMQIAVNEGAMAIAGSISEIGQKLASCEEARLDTVASQASVSAADGWKQVVRSGERAAYHDGTGHINEEVEVVRYFFSPAGLMYQLRHKDPETNWQVAEAFIKPIPGETQLESYNLNTGEVRSV